MTNFLGGGLQDAFRTELASGVDAIETELVFVAAPNFTLAAGEYVYGVIEPGSPNREGIKVTGIDENTVTVERGLPVYDGGPSTATAHGGGVEIILSDNWQTFEDIKTAINSKLDNNGGNAGASFDLQVGTMRIRRDGDNLKFTDANNLETTLSQLAAGAGTDTKAAVSNNDTTPGFLNGKLVAGTNVSFVENNNGGDETLTINAASANATAQEYTIYTPAYMTGGSDAEDNYLLWKGTDDGAFKITIDGVAYNITGLDFTGVDVTSMDDVAEIIQEGIRAATGSEETVVWEVVNTRFVITSVDETIDSEVGVLSTADGNPGTDISAVFMDATAGNGVATGPVLDEAAHEGLVVALNEEGKISEDFYNAIQVDVIENEGDILIGDGAGGAVGLPVGRDGFVIQADSGAANGLSYQPTGGLLATDFTQIVVAQNTTSDVFTFTVPGGILDGGMVEIQLNVSNVGLDATDDIDVTLTYGGNSLVNSFSNIDVSGDAIVGGKGVMLLTIIGINPTSQRLLLDGVINSGDDADPCLGLIGGSTIATNSANNQTVTVTIHVDAGVANTITVRDCIAKYTPPLNINNL